MPIYTKRGDKGETGLFVKDRDKPVRVSKDSVRVETLGVIDELNSYLGVCRSYCDYPDRKLLLGEIQGNLLTIGTIIAGSGLRFSSRQTKKLEKVIDGLETSLPPLKNFIYPGGSFLASYLQFARSLARKAERKIVALARYEKVSPQILSYINRLSDALFMLAREANHQLGIKDEVWVAKRR